MQIKAVEVYAEDSNYAIMKPPGRRFPGCVFQGDSLHILCSQAVNVARGVRDSHAGDEVWLEDLEELVGELVDRMLHYQRVLAQHEIGLPYTTPVTEQDRITLLPRDGAR